MSSTEKTHYTLLSAVAGFAVIVAVTVFVWYTTSRLKLVEQRLNAAEERSQTVLRQMTDYSRELEAAVQRAREAREQAAESEKLRAEAEAKSDRAEGEAEQARGDAQQARGEAQQARGEAQQAREDLEQLRQRRQQELERMQEALNRIAPTRRTPLGMVVELAEDSFKFDFDDASLRPENREMLSRIAGVLLASKGYRLYVYGHTDDIGTQEYNQGLSVRRARTVADYLIKAGVPPDIVSTKGYGKSSPRVKGTTRDARQQNRRVEIGIVDTIIGYGGAIHTH
jgi:outer membrane protein OmpA-like peptidoglycan-associated protein